MALYHLRVQNISRGQGRGVVAAAAGLAARLLAEEIAPDPALRDRLVAAHLIETVTPEPPGVLACGRPDQTGCLLAYAQAPDGDAEAARRLLDRAGFSLRLVRERLDRQGCS